MDFSFKYDSLGMRIAFYRACLNWLDQLMSLLYFLEIITHKVLKSTLIVRLRILIYSVKIPNEFWE